MGNDFKDYYEPNENWMDSEGVDVEGTLRGMYPEYFDKNDGLDIGKFREGLIKQERNAKELFRAKFKVKYKTLKSSELIDHPVLKNIMLEFGDKIIAHGVEEMKGGHHNLLMMAVTGYIKSSSLSWGELQPGPPNMSPVSHGPYYIINSVGEGSTKPSNPNIKNVAFIIVPFEENKTMLVDLLKELDVLGLITRTHMNTFVAKLITLESFHQKLKNGFSTTANNAKHVRSSQSNAEKGLSSSAHGPERPSKRPRFFKATRRLSFGNEEQTKPKKSSP